MGRSTVTYGFSKKYIFIIFRSSCRQMFFKTGVIGDFAIFTGKHLCWSLFLIKLRALGLQLYFNLVPKDFNTGVFLWKLRTPFFIEHLRWLLLSVWKSNGSLTISICQYFFNQKQKNVGWFVLKRLIDLTSLSYLPIISRNNSNTLLMINLQKTKTCPK